MRGKKGQAKFNQQKQAADIKNNKIKLGGKGQSSKPCDLIMIRHLGVKQRATSRFEKATAFQIDSDLASFHQEI